MCVERQRRLGNAGARIEIDVGVVFLVARIVVDSGSGSGTGGGGDGTGRGFTGKPVVPLSTARPQMPEWACDKGIRGWVEVMFTVMPSGLVRNVKLIDADPRGVFEAAAIESIGNWIYERGKVAREVKQRVPMNPEDCAYNWR